MGEGLGADQLGQGSGQEDDDNGAGQDWFQGKEIPAHECEIRNIKSQNRKHIGDIPESAVLSLLRLIDVVQLFRVLKDRWIQPGDFLLDGHGQMGAYFAFQYVRQEIGHAIQHLTGHIGDAQKRQREKGLADSDFSPCRVHRPVEEALLHHGLHAEGDAVENGQHHVCHEQEGRCLYYHRQEPSESACHTPLFFRPALSFH